MSDFDSFCAMNPPGKNQLSSACDRLLAIGAASESLLLSAKRELERLGLPFVCCFSQLPFPLAVADELFTSAASTEDTWVDLRFLPMEWSLNQFGEWAPAEKTHGKPLRTIRATQVVGFIRLRDYEVQYYKRYIESVSSGRYDDFINPHLHRLHQGIKKTAATWESQRSSALSAEFWHSIRNFLNSYSIIGRIWVPATLLAAQFYMFLPGRVAFSDSPIPLTASFLPPELFTNPSDSVKVDGLRRALELRLPLRSSYIEHLLAMVRLAQQGEPELALIGVAMAIETHLSSFVKWPAKFRPSISKLVTMRPCEALPSELKTALLTLASTRNEIIHGELPKRIGNRVRSVISAEDAIQLGFDVYRESHERKWTKT